MYLEFWKCRNLHEHYSVKNACSTTGSQDRYWVEGSCLPPPPKKKTTHYPCELHFLLFELDIN